MSRRTVFMFSGQGSQYFQMGRSLFDGHSTFRRVVLRMDRVLQSLGRPSVVESLYADHRTPSDVFDDIRLSHPAIFVVELAMAETLIEMGVCPDAVVGASLGTYAAGVVAGAMDAEAVLAVLARQPKAFLDHCPAGVMVAVLGPPAVFETSGLRDISQIAARHYDSHFVISGEARRWERIEAILQELNLTYVRLPVNLAFHSRWIEDAYAAVAPLLATVKFNAPHIPIYCSAARGRLTEFTADHLWAVGRMPIEFWETTLVMEREGPNRYVDVGPSGTLATFLKHGLPKDSRSTAHFVLSPFGGDSERLTALTSSTPPASSFEASVAS